LTAGAAADKGWLFMPGDPPSPPRRARGRAARALPALFGAWALLLCAAAPGFAVHAPEVPPGSYTQVSAWLGYVCALRTDATLVCFGFIPNAPSVLNAPAGTFRAVSAGNEAACAIRTDGTLSCWGDNTYGQASPPPGVYTAVTSGAVNACALRADQTLACWGAGAPLPGTFVAYDAGVQAPCGVHPDGTLVCDPRLGPPPAGTYIEVSAQFDLGGGAFTFSCALRTDREAACWGQNTGGQLDPPAGPFTTITTGGQTACALRSDQTLACWGGLDVVGPPPGGTFRSVAVGDGFACAVRTDGVLLCWPGNQSSDAAADLPPAFGGAGVFSLPSNRVCVSRRHFRIRIRRQRGGVTLISAAVAVDGRRVAVRKGRRLTAPVDLRGLPRGRFTVRISALTNDGRAISGTRRYRTCARRAPSPGPGPV
jgi:hypothetical protein